MPQCYIVWVGLALENPARTFWSHTPNFPRTAASLLQHVRRSKRWLRQVFRYTGMILGRPASRVTCLKVRLE